MNHYPDDDQEEYPETVETVQEREDSKQTSLTTTNMKKGDFVKKKREKASSENEHVSDDYPE